MNWAVFFAVLCAVGGVVAWLWLSERLADALHKWLDIHPSTTSFALAVLALATIAGALA